MTLKRMVKKSSAVRIFQILLRYGRRHHSFGVKEQMMDFMAESFILAIQPSLEDT